MIPAMRSKLMVVLLLCFCINVTVADRKALRIQRRDGPTTPTNTVVDSTTIVSSKASTTASNEGDNGSKSSTPTAATTGSNSNATSSSTSSTVSTSLAAVASNLNGAAPTSFLNYSGYNSTLTPDTLPINPQITPGFAVSGVILMLTGIMYTLVGIKNKFLHTFLSAAYLASVSVTVLIIYVMNPPISNAIQGAYVVAITITGLILGGAAIIFTELTEGLGCLLGGFCFSMWLLVLKPGGLLTATSSKAIFIAVFTIAAFSTSFSHHTRPYGLIVSIPFSGATAVVLGLDCFSRAGLKEFWAYLWALNTNLFPLGATSYPLTRGIRVEIAAIVVIFLAGIVSQMRLWKVIKGRREQRAEERKKDMRNMAEEEENVGRRIEHTNAQDRDQWEAVYGDKHAIKSTTRDSGVGDMESQKKGPVSSVTTTRPSGSDDEIEMAEMRSPTMTTNAGLVMASNGEDGAVTVRVIRDPEPEPDLDENGNIVSQPANHHGFLSPRNSTAREPDDEDKWIVGADGEARLERRPSKRDSNRKSIPTVAPDVIPLPFKVPEGEFDDDRSSVATFADEDPEQNSGHLRRSTSKRLSAASAIIRRLSRRSQRNSKGFVIGEGISTEELVSPHAIEEDRRSSIAATVDGLSDDEDVRSVRSSFDPAPDTKEAAQMPEESKNSPATRHDWVESTSPLHLAVPGSSTSIRPISEATVATDILDAESVEGRGSAVPEETEAVLPVSLTSSTDPKATAKATEDPTLIIEETKKGESVASGVNSRANSITKDRLPPQLSRVVMSYRTNEWAKHLSNADAPEFEELKLAEYQVEEGKTIVAEKAAPVNVEELQQTSHNAAPPPAPRSVSQSTNHISPPLTRSNSALSKVYPSQSKLDHSDPAALLRSLSQHSLGSQATSVPRGFRSSSQPYIPQAIVESPIEEDFPASLSNRAASRLGSAQSQIPFGSTTTLIGKRDTMVRNKITSFYSGHQPLISTPELNAQFPQYASRPVSLARAGSDAGSAYNYANASTMLNDDDEEMSLSTRRELIRQSSILQASGPPSAHQNNMPFDSHQPRRQSSAPSQLAREQQMANWRASVQQEFNSGVQPRVSIERQRSALWHERQQEEHRRAVEERKRGERDNAFDERMRRGDMLDAHREALRKMQASANKSVQASS